jgi:hypothetical protein
MVTERAVYSESGGRSGLNISHKQDFLYRRPTLVISIWTMKVIKLVVGQVLDYIRWPVLASPI